MLSGVPILLHERVLLVQMSMHVSMYVHGLGRAWPPSETCAHVCMCACLQNMLALLKRQGQHYKDQLDN